MKSYSYNTFSQEFVLSFSSKIINKTYKLPFRSERLVKVMLCLCFLPVYLDHNTIKAENIYNKKDTISNSLNNIAARDTIPSKKLPESYQILKEKTSKNKWMKKIFSSIIKEPSLPRQTKRKELIANEYKSFESKVIRNINITVLPPFGTSVKDPERKSSKKHTFNDFHVLTQESVIRNNLQFTTGEQVSPVLIAETEAYLLNLGYINDTEINIEQIADTELVDVNIIVRDKWTLGVDIRKFDLSGSHIEVFQKNFLGRGNQIRANLLYNHDFTDRVGFGGSYLQRNISHTFIDMQGSYLDDINSRQLSASIKRDLQINLDYFGEIRYSRNQTRTNIAVWDSISPDFRESYSVSLGRAITLPSNYASKRIIFSASYKQKSPKYKDEVYQNHMKDKLLRYQDTENTMWLAQASFYKYAYVREYLLHNFGTAENIAEGYNVSLQGGYSLFKHLPDGMYASFKASYGSYHILNGNIYAEAAISSFFRRSEPYESVLKTEIRYFSPLFRLNSGRMRQFFTLNYTKLLTSNRYFSDQIYLDETNLRVDKGDGGLEQLLFKSESDLFSNIEIIGFRFLFYSFLDMGWLTPKNNLFNKDNFFWGIGAGIRLRNDLLVFNTIDLKIGLYPKNQSGFNRYFDIKSSTPNISPNFVSSYPEEFVLY